MQAIVQDTYGTADVLRLRDIERPAIGDDEALIRVRAASLHIGDWHLMAGQPYLVRILGLRAPRDRVRGMDLAGTVEAVGARVTRFRAGDKVYGSGAGAFAEFSRAKAGSLASKPSTLTFEQAAAVPNSACTALQGLRDVGKIQPGQAVLIVGASGGVGLFAVQLAKAFGAEVTGVCSGPKLDLVGGLGADRVIDYTTEDFTRGGRRFHLILDSGGSRSLADLRRVLAPTGTLVIVGGEGGNRWFGPLDRQLRALALAPFVGQTLRSMYSTPNTADLQTLAELIDAGKLKPIVDRTYPLCQTPDAMRYVASGQARGKIVITFPAAGS
jgi:NADPH:quinone reductase-like Zn-dependent oxidoreductase